MSDDIEMVSADQPYVPSGRGASVNGDGVLGMFNNIEPDLAPGASKPAVNENFNGMPMSGSLGPPTGTSGVAGQNGLPSHNEHAFQQQNPPTDHSNVTSEIHKVWKIADEALKTDSDEVMYRSDEENYGINKVIGMIDDLSKFMADKDDIIHWLGIDDTEVLDKISSVGNKLAKQLGKYKQLAISINNNKVG
jgi:hypothetical protein